MVHGHLLLMKRIEVKVDTYAKIETTKPAASKNPNNAVEF